MDTSKILLYLNTDMYSLYEYAYSKYYEFADLIINGLDKGWFIYGVTEYGPDTSQWFVTQLKEWFPTAYVPLFKAEKRALPPYIHDGIGGLIARWRLSREDRFLYEYRYDITEKGGRRIVSVKDEVLQDLLKKNMTPECPESDIL